MLEPLRFIRHWFAVAASDVLRSMGTTALAVGVGLAAWAASLVYDLAHGGKANWSDGLTWAVGATLVIWLFLFGRSLRRHFCPVLREHRRVFHMLAFDQDQHTDPGRISIWCLLQFCKDSGPATLTVRVNLLVGVLATSVVVHREELEHVSRDERKRLQLGSLRIERRHRPTYHSIWGSEIGTEDLKQGQVTMIPGSTQNLIEISAWIPHSLVSAILWQDRPRTSA
jgi:hypothetical protein